MTSKNYPSFPALNNLLARVNSSADKLEILPRLLKTATEKELVKARKKISISEELNLLYSQRSEISINIHKARKTEKWSKSIRDGGRLNYLQNLLDLNASKIEKYING